MAWVELNDLLVSDGGLVRLGALLVKDAQVVPDLTKVRLQCRGLDNGVKRLCGLVEQKEQDGVRGPEDRIDGLFVLDLLEALVCLRVLLKNQVAATTDVKRVSVVFGLALGLLDLVERLYNLALLEGTPG